MSALADWLTEVVKPNLAPKTYEKYEMFVRLFISPYLGHRRLDKLTARDVRHWLNQLREACQCCAQGKDARRPEPRRRCCAIGRCCHQAISPRTGRDARDTLRAALTHAVNEDELISRNVAAAVRLPASRTRKIKAWSVTETCTFLESARTDRDPLYLAYVLMLVLGRILRHSKIEVTMEVYTEVPDDITRDALRRLGEQLGSYR